MSRAYVIRCSPVHGRRNGDVAWRFSVQSAEPDAPRHAFHELVEVVSFIESELEQGLPPMVLPAGRSSDDSKT